MPGMSNPEGIRQLKYLHSGSDSADCGIYPIGLLFQDKHNALEIRIWFDRVAMIFHLSAWRACLIDPPTQISAQLIGFNWLCNISHRTTFSIQVQCANFQRLNRARYLKDQKLCRSWAWNQPWRDQPTQISAQQIKSSWFCSIHH